MNLKRNLARMYKSIVSEELVARPIASAETSLISLF